MSATSLERPISGLIYRLEDVNVNNRKRISVQVSSEPLT